MQQVFLLLTLLLVGGVLLLISLHYAFEIGFCKKMFGFLIAALAFLIPGFFFMNSCFFG